MKRKHTAPIKLLITGISIAITGILFLSLVTWYFNSPPGFMSDEIIRIDRGTTLREAAENLKARNLITSETFFLVLAKASGNTTIKTGKYRIYRGMSALEILRSLTRGHVMVKKVTIPEGYNLFQVAERLDAEGVTEEDSFLYYAFDKTFLKSIGIHAPSAEGYMFPETYNFPEESDARDIIQWMYNQLQKELGAMDLSNMKELNLNRHTLLTMASLIEEEATVTDERELISAVFHNRMKLGMKLYCDPTVRYAVKKFSGRLTYSDLETDSPFNTYVRRGYPPTPISSPGKGAIHAALHPADVSYLYFVARNDGSHYFSKTLSRHNKAVEYYQKGIKNGFVDEQKKD